MRDKPFLATILTGPNAGAVIALSEGRSILGGGGHEQVVLDGVAPEGLAVGLKHDHIRLLPSAPGVALHDGQPLTPGQRHSSALPVTVRLGDDTLVNFSRSVPLPRTARGWRKGALAACLAAGIGLVLSANLRIELPTAVALAPAPEAPPIDSKPVAKTATPAPDRHCDPACLTKMATTLSQRAAAAGLTDIEITATGGLIRVGGRLRPDDIPHWSELRRSFEAEQGRSLPVVVNFGSPASEPAYDVTAVWLGPEPSVTLRDGRTLHVGQPVGEGWTVASIARDGVRLSRDDRQTVLRF